MQTIQLEDEEVERLLRVLDQNVAAVGKYEGVRWTHAAASRIDRVRQSIDEQTD